MRIRNKSVRLIRVVCIVTGVILLLPAWRPAKADDVRDIIFPIIGPISYSDDFGTGRTGHTHQGIDILGTKMQPLVAAQDGYINHVAYPEPDYGYAIFLHGDDNYDYWYLHVNNDIPGTDNGSGGGMNAYAPDIQSGAPVTKGQLIGYMGDSGNAESTHPHLHFEIHRPDDKVIDPYPTLQAAQKIAAPIFPPPLPGEIVPYQKFQGGATIARGDVDPDSPGEEIIIGAGPGGGPDVKVYSADNVRLYGFFAYATSFRGGVDVATGDVNGDGVDEIITGAGAGGGPQVRVFDKQGVPQNQFLAYAKTFRGGVRVAAADLNGDGLAEIVTSPGPGGGPHIRVFDRWGEVQSQFFAFDQSFRKGISVAAQPATASSPGIIITGAGAGGGPQVRIFDMQGTVQNQFFAFDQTFHGGINVAVGDIDESSPGYEIAVVPVSHGSPEIRIYSEDGRLLRTEQVFEPWWLGGYDIAAGTGVLTISTQAGPRRTSVRAVQNTTQNGNNFRNHWTPPLGI